jgi:hypothetical protein
MPAFTFEKLSAPTDHEPVAPAAEKQRSALGQLLDRLSEARIKRSMRNGERTKAPQTKAFK